MEVKASEIEQAMTTVPAKDLATLRLAAKRITAFHRRQLRKAGISRFVGNGSGSEVHSSESACYVPGGKASYPSTVLMNVLPAKVAGVKEGIMASPIGNDAAIILTAIKIAGVDRLFRVGGAQAIAALAFGTVILSR